MLLLLLLLPLHVMVPVSPTTQGLAHLCGLQHLPSAEEMQQITEGGYPPRCGSGMAHPRQ